MKEKEGGEEMNFRNIGDSENLAIFEQKSPYFRSPIVLFATFHFSCKNNRLKTSVDSSSSDTKEIIGM